MNELNMGNFIVTMVQTVILFTPIFIMAHNHGKDRQKLDTVVISDKQNKQILDDIKIDLEKEKLKLTELRRDMDGIGFKVSEIKDSQFEALNDVKDQMAHMNKSLIELTVTMKFIQEELKKK